MAADAAAAVKSMARRVARSVTPAARGIAAWLLRDRLRLVWLILLLWGEILYPYALIRGCRSPQDGTTTVPVIADPQLTDAFSYLYAGRGSATLAAIQFYSDLYMKRNWRYMRHHHDYRSVVFLGDLFDGGREWTAQDGTFGAELARFRRIFVLPAQMRPVWCAGNHDIGFGTTIVPEAYDRFATVFGPPNAVHEYPHHRIVVVDTIGLNAEPASPYYQAAYRFVASLPPSSKPAVLISHVPLYRPGDADCGPDRRTRPIQNIRGVQYQNLIQPQLTAWLLGAVRPQLTLSGDDHDVCHVDHVLDATGTHHPEWTIPTFSFLQGNPRPAYGMLHLHPDGTSTLDVCWLAPQMRIYTLYAAMLGVTLVATLYQLGRRAGAARRRGASARDPHDAAASPPYHRVGHGPNAAPADDFGGLPFPNESAGHRPASWRDRARWMARWWGARMSQIALPALGFYLSIVLVDFYMYA